ncbi:MULE transposase domain [Sesbania bispinosa]|nr:MULE transposase domain [Sesbania bispinosa]
MDDILDWMSGKDISMMDRDTPFWQEGSDEKSFIYASPSLVDQDGIDGFLGIKIIDMRKITRMKGMITPNTGKKTEMKDMNILNMKKKPNMKEIKILNMRKKTRMKEMKIMNMRKLSMNVFATKKGKVISSRKTGRVLQQNFERTWTSTQDDDQMNNMLKVGIGPPSVITDGDLAMRNAIRVVFPRVHHRLCARNLARNATSNVGILAFIKVFEHCFRTTSRCEGLHSELAKFVHSRHNLTYFLHHYNRCVEHMRVREMEDDFSSIHGDPSLQINLQGLERKLSVVNSVTIEEYNDAMERSLKELAEKEAKRACDMAGGREPTLSDHDRLRNPLPARHNGSVRASTSTGGLRVRRTTKCSICHVAGHNKDTCPQRAQGGHTAQSTCGGGNKTMIM